MKSTISCFSSCIAFIGMRFSTTIPRMPLRRFHRFSLLLGIVCVLAQLVRLRGPQQQAPRHPARESSCFRVKSFPVSARRAVLDVKRAAYARGTVNFPRGQLAPMPRAGLFSSLR